MDPFSKREIKPKIGCIMMKIIGQLVLWKQNLTNYMKIVKVSVKITRNVLNSICNIGKIVQKNNILLKVNKIKLKTLIKKKSLET